MANNKVQLADGTVLMDVTDTTALASTVKSGDIFYNAAGVRQTGTLIVDETYSIQQNLTNVTSSVDDTKVIAGNCFYTKLTPSEGYNILSVIVTMDGVDITREVFKEEFGTYNIIQNLTNVESSCDDVKTMAGTSFFANLTPFNDGTIEYIKVTMGGEDITEQVFKPGVGEKLITENGTYNALTDGFSGYDSVIVNVPIPSPILGNKNIVENGTYNASSDSLDGYSSVIVNVPSSTSNEKLLASGTYTVSSASSSITIDTGISNLDTTKPRKALVVGSLNSASAGFMKWFSVVYITGPNILVDTVGANFPKARYYNSAATAGGIVNYQNGSATNTICYIGTNGSTIVCRKWSNNYKIQPSTYSWYIWGEEVVT